MRDAGARARFLLLLVPLLSIGPAPAPAQQAEPPSAGAATGPRCSLMEGTRRTLLALPYEAFDQRADSGWRPLLEAGCPHAAAEIVEAYVERHPGRAADSPVLYFHAGQLRAFVGEREAAIAHMQAAIAAHARGERSYGPHWETYLGATIAFLKDDEAGLRRLFGRLRGRIDGPPGAPPAYDRSRRGDPEHIAIVEGLVECFGRPYREAYGECRGG